MKKLLLIGIILLICISGIGKISGVIKSYWPEVGFKPSVARIDILNTGIFTISSSYGNYIINNIPDGQHTIIVSKHGYYPAKKIINIVEGQKVTGVDFNLRIIGGEVPRGRLGGVDYLGFNLDCQPFNDLRIRQALNYAIDKKTLVDEINSKFGRKLVVARSPLPPSMIGYNPNIIGYPYDISNAKDLLSQAGYPKGFNIDLYYCSEGNSIGKFIVREVKRYLAQIGIKVDLKGKKWEQLVKMAEQGKLPFFVMGWRADTPDPADYLYSLYHSKGYSNFAHYSNSMIDNQIEQAWGIMDDEKFVQLIQQIESTIVDNAPAIYIDHY